VLLEPREHTVTMELLVLLVRKVLLVLLALKVPLAL